jgi:lysophospholipase L1-like esterase
VRGYIDQQVRQWGVDYEDLIRRVRSRAANTRIVAINVPNLGAAPYVAGRPIEERSILQRIAVGLADRVNALTGQNVLVVDLLCDPRIYQASNFSSDGFHPNDQGYQLLADLTYPALANGTAPAPSATCPQRTLLPVF